ncbi:MAG: C15orf41 family protein [Candidatus Thermoplasmatota archaeon]|nr:C15orf41 family protein [Candidatus Thermoplasmatota archaeon]
MLMNETEYREIYSKLNDYEDIEKLWRGDRNRPLEFYLVVYTQKTIRDVTSRYQRVRSKLPGLVKRWRSGRSLLDISRELDFSPVMTGYLILTSQSEWGKSTFRNMINDPRSIKDPKLRKELIDVRDNDPIYSPEGNLVQRRRGLKGEARMKEWLDDREIPYKREEDLRATGGKTPDFLLERPIYLRGEKVNWIESKASFGDMREVRKNLKNQLLSYRELFGSGMVIYWFGILDDLPVEEGIIIETEEVLGDHWDLS